MHGVSSVDTRACMLSPPTMGRVVQGEKYQKKATKKMIIILLVLIVIAFIFIVIFAKKQ